MKKKVLAVVLAAVMTMGMSMTAFAATSSNTSSNSSTSSSSSSDSSSSSSSSSETSTPAATTPAVATVEKAAPGAEVSKDSVSVAVVKEDGTVAAQTLTEYVAAAETSVVTMIATETATGKDAGAAVSQLMTRPATPMFQATINALGGKAGINDCGTKKTLATAQDAFGNIIASAGKIEGVTSGSLIMLMSVNADGTVEFVEGVVDPVTGQILGAFKGTPVTITVLVFIPAL